MPSAVDQLTGHPDSHPHHPHTHPYRSRRSSQSQPSLTGISTTATPAGDPSLALLPSTTYSQAETPSKEPSKAAADPHDFYRPYQDLLGQGPSLGLHQDALSPSNSANEGRSQDRQAPPLSSSDGRGGRSTSGTRQNDQDGNTPIAHTDVSTHPQTRRASFRDLVARFDSPAATPPLPTLPTPPTPPSLPYSAANPHSSNAAAQAQYFYASNSAGATAAKQTRPLFGELAPGRGLGSGVLGYGIVNATRRRGSEGSPMHSPNAMFPLSRASGGSVAGADSSAASTEQREPREQRRPQHRRAHSDMAGTLSPRSSAEAENDGMMTPMATPPRGEGRQRGHGSGSNNNTSPASRIPVSNDRGERAGANASTSSNTNQQQAGREAAGTRRPKHASPKRRPLPLTSIHSPGRHGRGRLMANGDKSPSLRAKIIAPPPKISPQLRSSRPRVPVSAASTASSRAKVAEKIQAMSRGPHDGWSYSSRRARPPELSDVDLKARRLRITQALTRSLEGADLAAVARPGSSRGGSTSRKSSLDPSYRQTESPPPIPAATATAQTSSGKAEAGNTGHAGAERDNDHDGDIFIMPDEDARGSPHDPFAQFALSAVQGFSADGDSPTLGLEEHSSHKLPPRLLTSLQLPHDGNAASSAALSAVTQGTVDTTTTVIEPEEQLSAAEPPTNAQAHAHAHADLSLLTSINRLREQTSPSSRSNRSNPSSSSADRHDFGPDSADQESVNIVFRNTTTYLDDEEAVAKGYRPFFPPPVPALPDLSAIPAAYDAPATGGAASWTSSLLPSSEAGNEHDHEREPEHDESERLSRPTGDRGDRGDREDQANAEDDEVNGDGDDGDDGDMNGSHAAMDTYTFVNIFLQQHSASGVVDQQLVDDLYQRIITHQPDLTHSEAVDPQQVEELCIIELDHIEREWRKSIAKDGGQIPSPGAPSYSSSTPQPASPAEKQEARAQTSSPLAHLGGPSFLPPSFRAHHYKSSLDSAEDWADTSPSVGDWIKYAINPDEEDEDDSYNSTRTSKDQARPPSHSPPPPPSVAKMGSIEQMSYTSSPLSEPPTIPPRLGSAGAATAGGTAVASASKARTKSSSSRSLTATPTPESVVASQTEVADPAPVSENGPQEQKRLKQRRHVIKELVDTEYTYERDLRVLCDIYRQTATAALADDDVKVLFGNIEQVQTFARNFLIYLKQTAKPAYVMERSNPSRAPSTKTSNDAGTAGTAGTATTGTGGNAGAAPGGGNAGTATGTATTGTGGNASAATGAATNALAATAAATQADRASIHSDPLADLSEAEKDRHTRLGEAFIGSMTEMESIYTEYIRTRHAANQRFADISSNKGVREWLRECRSNSSDITNAWSLDALLVKPVQRITKYPLLLNELIASTPPDHPDLAHLRQAALQITEINVRINEVKKHTELVDQVMNRKRKESDVRNGITKAWGRRAEKLKQHVGINETYEDGEYSRLKMDYDNNCIHLFIVSKDCQGYLDALRAWINRLVEIAVCAEAWVDIGHSNNPIAESKLRQLAIAVRGISTIALPDHIDAVNKRVIVPMEKCKAMLERFSLEPKGLIQKREKKLLDYTQAKNKKDRGERLDRRMIDRMEQWEAINHETKQRMRKLREATAHMVQACLGALTHLHAEWLALVQKKLAAAMAIPLESLTFIDGSDIEKEWQADFDFYEATVLALGICNGTLRNDSSNIFSPGSFLSPSGASGASTLAGEESPRHSSSWHTKRSASLNGDSPQFAPPPGLLGSVDAPSSLSFRHSGQHVVSPPMDHGLGHGPDSSSFGAGALGRLRAASVASGRIPGGSSRASATAVPPMPKPLTFSRPGTSVSHYNDTTMATSNNNGPPRVSLDMPSPLLHATPGYPTHGITPPQRPASSQTYFSAVPTPSMAGAATPNSSAPNSAGLQHQNQHQQLQQLQQHLQHRQQQPEQPPVPTSAYSAVLYTVASLYEFNIDRSRQEAGLPYLTYAVGEIFDVVGEKGELWLARNQDDPSATLGWIWCKHFAMLGD